MEYLVVYLAKVDSAAVSTLISRDYFLWSGDAGLGFMLLITNIKCINNIFYSNFIIKNQLKKNFFSNRSISEPYIDLTTNASSSTITFKITENEDQNNIRKELDENPKAVYGIDLDLSNIE